MNSLDDLLPPPVPSADRPLAGLTLLLVEDSRLASEGLRLLCRRSGARLRRADTLEAAEKHLRTYRPGAVLVDLHLPDGSGTALIATLHARRPRIDAILATSGDPSREGEARAAGADAFLRKPASLGEFQAAILACLPPDRRPAAPRPYLADAGDPDPTAFREDLEHAMQLLAAGAVPLDYVTGFLRGVASSAGDDALLLVVATAAQSGATEPLHQLLRARLAAQPVI